MPSNPPQPIAAAEVTEIRLGTQVLLLARPGRHWPAELGQHRPRAQRVAALLAAFRHHTHAISQLRLFWDRYNLAGVRLDDAGLLHAFAVALQRQRVDALLLPRGHPGVAYQTAGDASARVPTGASDNADGDAALPVAQWSLPRKLAYVVGKAAGLVPSELVSMVRALATPAGVAWLTLFASLEVAGDLAGGVGLVADAVLIGLLWATSGLAAVYGAIAFGKFLLHTVQATSQAELDAAAQELVRAATLLGIAGLSALGGWAKTQGLAARTNTFGISGSGKIADTEEIREPPSRVPTARSTAGGGGAGRGYPYGFSDETQFQNACQELQSALRTSGIDDARIGVRGSSVTGFSAFKGTAFGPQSDIDFYVESQQLTDGYTTSKSIPGFVHPDKILPDYPALQAWSEKWSTILGREVTPGAFVPGTVPDEPSIIAR